MHSTARLHAYEDVINRRQQKLDDLKNRMDRAERQILERQYRRLELAAAAVATTMCGACWRVFARSSIRGWPDWWQPTRTLLLQRRDELDQLNGQLEALSPLAILDRGYALVFDSAGVLLKDAERVKAGDEISARLAKGTLTATVKRDQRAWGIN